MRTAFELGNSNCPWCLNKAVDELHTRAEVRDVALHASSGCLAVQYEGEPGQLLERVRATVRGCEQADNGESVMVELDVREDAGCRVSLRRRATRCARQGQAWAPGPHDRQRRHPL